MPKLLDAAASGVVSVVLAAKSTILALPKAARIADGTSYDPAENRKTHARRLLATYAGRWRTIRSTVFTTCMG